LKNIRIISNDLSLSLSLSLFLSDKTKLIAAYRKLLRVAIIVFHRVYITGGFLRAEYVRRRGGREFS